MLDSVDLNAVAEDRVDDLDELVGVLNLGVQRKLLTLRAFGLK